MIGTGFGARVVAPAFDAAARVRGGRGRLAARRRRRSRAAIARPDVDLVSVHSPPFLHAAHVRAALGAGKAVLCDKPFALDAAEAAAARRGSRRGRRDRALQLRVPLPSGASAAPRAGAHRCARCRSSTCSGRTCRSGSRVPLRRYGWLFDRGTGRRLDRRVGLARRRHDPVVLRRGRRAVDAHARIDVLRTPRRPRRAAHAAPPKTASARRCGLDTGVTVSIDSSFAASAPVPPRLTVLGADGVCEILADERVVVRRADGTREDLTPDAGDERGADRHARSDAPLRRGRARRRDER